MKKYIKWMIFFLIFLIILLTVILIINSKSGDVNNLENSEVQNIVRDDTKNDAFSAVKDKNGYFIVKNIIDRYIQYTKKLNGDSYINTSLLQISREEAVKSTQEEAKKFLLNVLDEDYKKEFNISEKFIVDEAKKYMKQGDYSKSDVIYNLNFNEMYECKYTDNITLFLVQANIDDIDLKLLIKFNSNTNNYSIFLSDYMEKYNYNISMSKDKINVKEDNLEDTVYNKLIIGTISDEDMAKEYFNIQKNNLLYDMKKEYNNLNDEYKEKKYPNYSNFEEYFSKLQSSLINAKLDKYSVENDTYTLIDNNDRYYIIEINKGLFDYKVKLDDYTIVTDKFRDVYNSVNDQKKVVLNVNKIITAINEKDYKYVYSKLADSFKDNKHYTNEKILQDYLSSNLFESNMVSYREFSKESNNLYSCKLDITDKTATSENKINMDIIIQLEEGTDFVMSFSIE